MLECTLIVTQTGRGLPRFYDKDTERRKRPEDIWSKSFEELTPEELAAAAEIFFI